MKRCILAVFTCLLLPFAASSRIEALAIDIGLGTATPFVSGDVLDAASPETGMGLDTKFGAVISRNWNLYLDIGTCTNQSEHVIGDPTLYSNTYFTLNARYLYPLVERWDVYVQGGPGVYMMSLDGDLGRMDADPVVGGFIGTGFNYYPLMFENSIYPRMRFGLEVNYHFASFNDGEVNPDPGSSFDIPIDGRGDMVMVMFTMGYDIRLPKPGGREKVKEAKPKETPPAETTEPTPSPTPEPK